MPVTTSAKRSLKKDRRREKLNSGLKDRLRFKLHRLKKNPSAKLLSETYSIIDRTAKKNLIHRNKAAHLKSQISKTAKTKKS